MTAEQLKQVGLDQLYEAQELIETYFALGIEDPEHRNFDGSVVVLEQSIRSACSIVQTN